MVSVERVRLQHRATRAAALAKNCKNLFEALERSRKDPLELANTQQLLTYYRAVEQIAYLEIEFRDLDAEDGRIAQIELALLEPNPVNKWGNVVTNAPPPPGTRHSHPWRPFTPREQMQMRLQRDKNRRAEIQSQLEDWKNVQAPRWEEIFRHLHITPEIFAIEDGFLGQSTKSGAASSEQREFSEALLALRQLASGELWDLKANTSGAAYSATQELRTNAQKRSALLVKFNEWQEGTTKIVQHWFEKLLALASAFDCVGIDKVGWSRNQILEIVRAQCDVTSPFSEPESHHLRISHSVRWWFAVASQCDFDVNMPNSMPWIAPNWLAKDGRDTDQLLHDKSRHLQLRISHIIEQLVKQARVDSAVSRGAKRAEIGLSPLAPTAQHHALAKTNGRTRARSKKSAALEAVKPIIERFWRDHPDCSHTDMVSLLGKAGIDVPWPNCASWDEALVKCERALKSLLSKCRTSALRPQ